MRFQELLDKERNEGIEVGRNTILDTYAWLKQNNRDADADKFMEHGNVEFRNKMIEEYRETTEK